MCKMRERGRDARESAAGRQNAPHRFPSASTPRDRHATRRRPAAMTFNSSPAPGERLHLRRLARLFIIAASPVQRADENENPENVTSCGRMPREPRGPPRRRRLRRRIAQGRDRGAIATHRALRVARPRDVPNEAPIGPAASLAEGRNHCTESGRFTEFAPGAPDSGPGAA